MKDAALIVLALLVLGVALAFGDAAPQDDTLYLEMVQLWQETNGQYGWPANKN